MLPLVSIITPSYNQAHFIQETIESVLAQDYPNIEYIIVDGSSTDGSVEIIQKYSKKLAWWVSEQDKGHADALNKGFSHAKGEILAWLNSDDTYSPHAVSEAVEFLVAHPDVSLVYANANLIDENGAYLGRFLSKQTNYDSMLRGSVHIPQATTFFWAKYWQQVGPLDLSLKFSFDYDLWVRLAKLAPIVYIPHVWANFRLHSQGKSIYLDDRCYPDMIRVSQRETGKKVTALVLRWYLRRISYAWIPIRWRIKLRQVIHI
jgi:glycosyltransferase involved in cell wall biosynthesis